MGAGAFRAGSGPAGGSPTRRSVGLGLPNGGPRAALYDPATKSFRLNPDGTFVEVHEVDQGVAMALGMAAGSILAAPATGHTLLSIPRGSSPSRQNDADDRVKKALAGFVSRGDIQILNVITEVPTPDANGRILAAVEYRNLRLGSPKSTIVNAKV